MFFSSVSADSCVTMDVISTSPEAAPAGCLGPFVVSGAGTGGAAEAFAAFSFLVLPLLLVPAWTLLVHRPKRYQLVALVVLLCRVLALAELLKLLRHVPF